MRKVASIPAIPEFDENELEDASDEEIKVSEKIKSAMKELDKARNKVASKARDVNFW
jgi:hypothetical protein